MKICADAGMEFHEPVPGCSRKAGVEIDQEAFPDPSKAQVELQALIEKARLGDLCALGQLFERHRLRLRSALGFRLRGSRLEIDLEDLLQETFVRACRAIGNFRWQGENSFLRWLQGIAGNVILKERDLHLRRKEFHLERDVPARDASPSACLSQIEQLERLQGALQKLSPEHRRVILLARIDGVRINEIARLMNRSPDAVSHLLMRAVEKLKQYSAYF